MKQVKLKSLRVLCFVGLMISVWLTWLKYTGQIDSIAGCDGGGDCTSVLGSRWSQVFFVPVSLLSSIFYAGLLAMSFRARAKLMFVMGLLLVGAALWFTGIQAFVLKSFCPWCLGLHSVGLACGVLILMLFPPRPSERMISSVMAGMLLGVLMLGQVFGPRPPSYLLIEEVIPMGESGQLTGEEAEGRRVVFFGGMKSYLIDELPHVGAVDAPHVMVEYFDYLCGSCKDLQGDVKALKSAYPGKLAVILLPSPLNRACNPGMTDEMDDHAGACEVARLSLAAWRARPDVFERIHNALFLAFPVSPESARAIVLQHIPEAELDAALADPWIERQLASNLADFGSLASKTPKMPKLLIKESVVMHGLSSSAEEFVAVVAEALELDKDGLYELPSE